MNRSGVVVYRVMRVGLVGFMLILLASCSPRNMAAAQGLSGQAIQTQTLTENTPTKPSAGVVKIIVSKTQALPKTHLAQQRPKVVYAYPKSYRASKGEGRAQAGLYDYFDNSGRQLTDGVLGGNNVLADLGRGHANEWVAWGLAQPRMQFKFARSVSIKRVEIRFNRNDKAAISLPSKVIINGKTYKVNPNKIPNQTSGFLGFDGAFVGKQINIRITRGKGWVFVDEVRFVDP